LDEHTKQEVQIEVSYEFNRDYFSSYISSVELRLGIGRLYIVKNMKEFLDHIYTTHLWSLAKILLLTLQSILFQKGNKKLSIYSWKYMKREAFGTKIKIHLPVNAQCVFDKKVLLSTPYLLRIFDALKNRNFYAKVLDYGEKLVSIAEEDLPLDFSLSRKIMRFCCI